MTSFKNRLEGQPPQGQFKQTPAVGAAQTAFVANGDLHADLLGADNPRIKNVFEQARVEGYEAGVQQAKDEYAREIQVLKKLITEIHAPLDMIDEAIENSVAELSLGIAKQIVQREFKIDSGRVIGVVKEALSKLPGTQANVTIRVNPRDVQLVEKIFNDSVEQHRFAIHEDPAIASGGCKINTEFAEVDATIETQLASIMSQVFGGMRTSDE